MNDNKNKMTVYFHMDCLLHDTGTGLFDGPGSNLLTVWENHPESVERYSNMLSILKKGPIAPYLNWQSGRHASKNEILMFHAPEYIQAVANAERDGLKFFAPATKISRGTSDAAYASAGTTLSAVTSLLEKLNHIAYALIRPPGHHASRNQADGYCFFNNAALAASQALKFGLKRIAILDLDVHHGNGTQEGFYKQKEVLTISVHMAHGPWGVSHPQTGKTDEIGAGEGEGYNMNIPLPLGTGDHGYSTAFDQLVIPALTSYCPELIIVPLGLDANQFDPNGRQTLSMEGFRTLGKKIRNISRKISDDRLLIVQEGGYSVGYTAFCLHAFMEGILETGALLEDPCAYLPENSKCAQQTINEAKSFFEPYWQNYKALSQKEFHQLIKNYVFSGNRFY
ncbi:MAG: hypothetical protein K9L30_13080 [Desulfobacterales bacterium]|nr:hypothetical protein [Desulfobacterales bacterium]